MKILAIFLLISTFIITPFIFAEEDNTEGRTDSDVILVAARQKLDAYSADDGIHLGKFSSLTNEDGDMLMTPHAILKTSDNKILVAGFGAPTGGKYVTLVKLNLDGTFSSAFFEQDIPTAPLNNPTRLIELSDGSILVFESSNKKVFKFSSDGSTYEEIVFTGTAFPANKMNDMVVIEEDGVEKIVVVTSDQYQKIVEYNMDGSFSEDLTPSGTDIRNPATIEKLKNGDYFIIDITYNPKRVILLDQYFFIKDFMIQEDLMKPTFGIENPKTGDLIIIDQGRHVERSYDDNLEIFKIENEVGTYQHSIGTYEDGTLRNLIFADGITKEW